MRFFNIHKKKEYTDEELLVRLKETGESQFFDLLYERYIPLVYGLCLKYLQDADKSQDAVIDIFEGLSPKASSYEINNFKNWLYSVVKNHCFQILRQNKKELVVDFDSQFMESGDVLDLLGEDANEERDKESVLAQCLDKLPEPQKITVSMFFYEDRSYQDIVDETGYHMKSVKSYLQNGKRNLKICIEKNIAE